MSPAGSRNGEDRDDGGVSSGVAAELMEGEMGTLSEMGICVEGIEKDTVPPEAPEISETEAVGDPVIDESERKEPERELSSEMLTLAMVGLGSVNEAIDSVRSREETSDFGRAGITAIGVASSSLDEMDTSVLASLIGTYSSNATSDGARDVIDGNSS